MANNDDDGDEGDDGDEDDTDDDDGARNSLRPKYKGSSCMRTSVGTDTHMHTRTHTHPTNVSCRQNLYPGSPVRIRT